MIRERVYSWLRAYAQRHDLSDPRQGFVIGGMRDPYMRRWFLLPRNPVFNLYLHQIMRSDDDRALHDHPWINLSWILAGGYYEVLFCAEPAPGKPLPRRRRQWRAPGFVGWRWAHGAHLLVLGVDTATGGTLECWSLFMTGPRLREWGFWCGDDQRGAKWIHWRRFTDGPRAELIGAGCDG